MKTISIQDFRCFEGRHNVNLAPITYLVGENSTGKSSFLSATRIAYDLLFTKLNVHFNEPPFSLGSYDEIAFYPGGNKGRAKNFCIGSSLDETQQDSKSVIDSKFIFSEGLIEPSLIEAEVTIDETKFILKFSEGDNNPSSLTVKSPKFQETIQLESEDIAIRRFIPSMGLLDFLIFADMDIRGKFETEKIKNKYSSITKNFGDNYFPYRHSKSQRPYSIAPIRTKPSRTYDPLTEVPGPEVDHVPMMLSKLDLGKKSDWTEIRNSLNKFGDNSGMFQDVSIKRKGRTGADPFQIGVKISGPPKNLINVGYGVSQVLPVIFDLTRLSDHSLFLLQQPEVHLHPKAQASLGTFVVDQMLKHNQKFIN